MVERFVQSHCLRFQNAGGHLNSGSLEQLQSFSRMIWIWVDGGHDNLTNASANDGIRARRRAPVGTARFQSDVQLRSVNLCASAARVIQRFNFRVRFARPAMPATTNDLAGFHQNRAHHWIRRGLPIAAFGQSQGHSHVMFGVRLLLRTHASRLRLRLESSRLTSYPWNRLTLF